jgi:hypothetical protein
VQRDFDYIERHTDHIPDLTQISGDRWRLVMDSGDGRVVMTLDYVVEPGYRPRWRRGPSTLYVNGERRPVLRDRGFFDLWNGVDPEAPLPARREPSPLPPAADVRQAPALVKTTYRMWQDKIGDRGELFLGRDGRRWVLAFTTDRISMQFTFLAERRGRCAPSLVRPLELFVDGVDKTAEAEGELAKALELAFPPPPPTSPAPAAVTATSVKVRNQAVIRT